MWRLTATICSSFAPRSTSMAGWRQASGTEEPAMSGGGAAAGVVHRHLISVERPKAQRRDAALPVERVRVEQPAHDYLGV